MEYGLIGEHLGHSFSREIHRMLSADAYELHEVSREGLDAFMRERSFKGINVTIPYKESVIPYLDYISDDAKAIGAVNTIVNRGGKLFGYNTDFEGLKLMAIRSNIDFTGRHVLILGVGGAAKTAHAVAASLGAGSVTHAARSPKDSDIDIYSLKTGGKSFNYNIIINATPVGMFPNNAHRVVDINLFPCLEGVLDCIYNPLQTNLVLDAMERGIKASGGLYMLVAQAVAARNWFVGSNLGQADTDRIYEKILTDKRNIVLCGMPSCGKTTIGKELAAKYGREFVDTDALIVERSGMEITQIFKEQGEQAFRDMESSVIRDISMRQGLVIALGGGAVLRSENVHNLKMNGRISFINRPLDQLIATSDRPLSSDSEALKALYHKRLPIYKSIADNIINNDEELSNILS